MSQVSRYGADNIKPSEAAMGTTPQSADSKEVKASAKLRPPAAGKGRPKGAVNKATKELKDMILGALDGAGGVEYLVERANDPRTASAFIALVGKVLPMTIAGDAKNPLAMVAKIELVAMRPNASNTD